MTTPVPRLTLAERLEEAWFRRLYGRSLVYNTCWEDPAVDRRAMHLGAGARVLVIASAGCNALDYALESPERVIAVDANPRQTALLELKLAAIRHLDHGDAFALFGRGWHPGFADLYRERLRADLTAPSAAFWDAHGHWFARRESNLFTHGLTGLVTRGVHWRLDADERLGECVRGMFDQPDLAAQRAFYDEHVRPRFWTPLVRWFLSTPLFLSLVGVPMPQRRLLRRADGRDAGQVIQDMIDELFREVFARDNYFWGVYVFGAYGGERCPRYLTPEGFARLKAGLVDRIEARTCTVTAYLEEDGPPLTHAVLLDHMDWMSSYYPRALQEEWDALARRMAPGATLLFRSAHAEPPFIGELRWGPRALPLRAALDFRDAEARELARADRVHTYPGFHIAKVPA